MCFGAASCGMGIEWAADQIHGGSATCEERRPYQI
jgi:hypothetical protein